MRATRKQRQRLHRRHRCVATIVSAALSLALLLVPNSVANSDPTPPPNPTDQQITAAQQQKIDLATQVGQLSAEIAQMQAKVELLNGQAEQAEQLVAFAVSNLQDAHDAADAAKLVVVAAQAKVAAAKVEFSDFVRQSYMSGPTGGVAAGLLTATDPTQLLQSSDYLKFAADQQLDALSNLDKSTIEQANAETSSRAAVKKEAAATEAAQQAQTAALAKLTDAKTQQDQLNASMATTQTQLDTAQLALATLNNQRAAYDAYQEQQRILAEQRAAAAAAAAKAAAEAAALVRAQLQAAAEAAAALKARQSSGSSNSSSSPNSTDSTSGDIGLQGAGVTNAPSAGSWTAAMGQTAVNRAMQYLGWPYAWAGGTKNGPTHGYAIDFASRNDANRVGFDCSGLTLYGWAPYLSMPHLAESQYSVAGSYHPSVSNLMPGDLLFYSSNGAISGIHHVGMYIGNNNVIQAPQSGTLIQVTNINRMSSGYYGATRPRT